MRTARAAAVLAAGMLAAGCAHQGQERSWDALGQGDFMRLAPNTTTKSDVQRMLGRPLVTMTFRNTSEEVWDYRFMNGTFPNIAEVHFDLNGRVKYYTMYRDQCSLSPVGCP